MDYRETVNLPKTSFPMRANLTKREPEMLAHWESIRLYEKMRATAAGRPRYVLHDGPPYANGELHAGHALNKILKDFVVKSKQMAGYNAPYLPGWDCHGLPIEHKVVTELGEEAKTLSKTEVRQHCRAFALRYVGRHREGFKRLGVTGQWDRPYLTLSPSYVATIIRVFAEMYEGGWVYRGLKPIYWCPSCQTALAEAEVEYHDHVSPAIYVKFPAAKPVADLEGPVSFVIWTTTPWTLPGNLAICLHPDLEYVALRVEGEILIMASGLAPHALEACGVTSYERVGVFRGAGLEGCTYRHVLYPDRECPIILGDHVTLDAGTGCVHTAPGHGQEDYVAAGKYGIEPLSPVDGEGRFTSEAPGYEGLFVTEGNKRIIESLRASGALMDVSDYSHSYAHCWRCSNPVIYRATPQWFIAMDHENLREKSLEAIGQAEWIPAWGRERIGAMVAQRPDWCISRQRTWGVPIPIFYCKECREPHGTSESFQGIEELALSADDGIDRWFDAPAEELLPPGTVCAHCGHGGFEKETDILDVWFDSGVSHRAVCEPNPELGWPVDMYLEGSDQHRGWFQSSLIPAVATRGAPPYRTVLTTGYVIDVEGRKLSKKLGDSFSLDDLMAQYGADVTRLWIASENYRQDVRISVQIMKYMQDAYRRIRNTFRYILGNLADFPENGAVDHDDLEDVDRWALHQLQLTKQHALRHYAAFDFHQVFHRVHNFCAVELSSFYLDILKDRLYTFAASSRERRAAQTVMAEILGDLLRLLAPIIPYTCDEAWQYLPDHLRPFESVHLAEFPPVREECFLRGEVLETWNALLELRSAVSKALEEARREKVIGNSLEAAVTLTPGSEEVAGVLARTEAQLPWVFIVSQCVVTPVSDHAREAEDGLLVKVERAAGQKCARCWNYKESVGQIPEHPEICERCVAQLGGIAV